MTTEIRLMTEIKKMRDLQKEYFKSRDKGILSQSKAQEKLVDQMVESVLGQSQLFGKI